MLDLTIVPVLLVLLVLPVVVVGCGGGVILAVNVVAAADKC